MMVSGYGSGPNDVGCMVASSEVAQRISQQPKSQMKMFVSSSPGRRCPHRIQLWGLLFVLLTLFLAPGPVATMNYSDYEAFLRTDVIKEKDAREKIDYNGECVDMKNNKARFKLLCAHEVNRGAMPVANKDAYSGAGLFKLCILFKGFSRWPITKEDEDPNGDKSILTTCKKLFCFNLTEYSVFWLVVIGIPLSILIALISLCYLLTQFGYYMCCCFLCKKKPTKPNQVGPAKSTGTRKSTPSQAAPPKPTTSQGAAPPPKEEPKQEPPKEEAKEEPTPEPPKEEPKEEPKSEPPKVEKAMSVKKPVKK